MRAHEETALGVPRGGTLLVPSRLILCNPSKAVFRVAAHGAGTATLEIELTRH